MQLLVGNLTQHTHAVALTTDNNGVASISRDYTEQVFYPFLVKYLTESNQTWDQVIDEKQSNGSKWTHFSPISCNGKTRKQVFELINGSNPNKK